MKLAPEYISMLSQRSGLDLTVSRNCIPLAEEVTRATGRNVSASTFRRLFGFYSDDRNPQAFTLDAIAIYLGCTSWAELEQVVAQDTSGFGRCHDIWDATKFRAGDRFRLCYSPNRVLTLTCLGDARFRVEQSEGSDHLLVGDELTIHTLAQCFPLLASDCLRDGKSLGPYTAGKVSGLDEIEKL